MSNVAQKRPFASLVEDEVKPTMTTQDKRFYMNTVKALMRNKNAPHFILPVDPVAYNIPDYFEIIKKPMDLSTVQNKLKNDEYSTPEECYADIQLIFDNCYLYNNAGDPVYNAGKALEESFKKALKKAPVSTKNTTDKDMVIQSLPSPPSLPPTESIPVDKHMPDDQFKRCEAIVKELKKTKYRQFSWPFERPVDASAWNATDYYDIIKNPMDMSTYEKKLYEHQYSHEDQLRDDIRLMFNNCYLYNPPDHDVHKLGKKFEKTFDKIWDKLHEKIDKKEEVTAQEVNTPTTATNVATTTHTTHTTNTTHTANTTNTTTTATNNNNTTHGKSTILRLKLSVKPKEETPISTSIKIPLIKDTTPKLAIDATPPVSIQSKVEKKSPTVLPNHDKWFPAVKSDIPDRPIHTKPKEREIKEVIKPKEQIKPFDIHDIYDKIHNEKKLREQQKREEQEKRERVERMRREKERQAREEMLERQREFSRHMQSRRERDRTERLAQLHKDPIDISKQKMEFQKYESNVMVRDADWRDLFTWQRETVDYRHLPVPGFIRRSPVKIGETRRRLLSKCVRLEQSNAVHSSTQNDDDGSDMDVE